jgi:uncharacterized protein
MALVERLQADLVTAMKAREADAVAALRMAITAVKTLRAQAGHGGEVSDEEAVALIDREARKRTEAAEAYLAAGRAELADKEQRELAVLRRYLPSPLSDEELQAIVDGAVASTGASSPADLGRVLAAVMPAVRGRADGRQVNALVRARLSG